MKYQPITKEDIEDFSNVIFEFLCEDYGDNIEKDLRQPHNIHKSHNDLFFSRFIELVKSNEISIDEYFTKFKDIIQYSEENGEESIVEKFIEYFDHNYISKIDFDLVDKNIIFQIVEGFWYIKHCIENNLEIVVNGNIYENCYLFIVYEYSHFSRSKIYNFVNDMSDYERYVYIKEKIVPQVSDEY